MSEDIARLLSLHVTEDKLVAKVSAGPRQKPVSVCADELKTWLGGQNVCFGIDEDALANVAETLGKGRDTIRPVTVAQGEPPTRGPDGRVEYAFNTALAAGRLEKDGSMDFRDRGSINNVEAESVVATVIPPGVGQSGTAVNGEALPGLVGEEPKKPLAGQNVELSEDGLTYVAKTEGHAVLEKNRINITQEVRIEGDVDYEVGNLDFVGALVITGSVDSGFTVKAKRNITIEGSVERHAEIRAGGSVRVAGTIRCGTEKPGVVADGSIFAATVENSFLKARGDVAVEAEILGSKVKCLGCFHGSQATVRGCEIEAVGGIEVGTVGSEGGVVNTLTAGITLDEHRQLKQIRAKMEELNQAKESIFASFHRQYGEVIHSPSALRELSDKEREEFETAKKTSTQRQDTINDEINKLRERAEALEEEVAEEPDRVVAIANAIQPACTINIREQSWALRREKGPVLFYEDTKKGGIETVAYREGALESRASRAKPSAEQEADKSPHGLGRRLGECPADDPHALAEALSTGLGALKKKKFQTPDVYAGLGTVFCKAIAIQTDAEKKRALADRAFQLLEESLKKDEMHAQTISTRGWLYDVLGQPVKGYEQHKRAAEIIRKLPNKGSPAEIHARQATSYEALAAMLEGKGKAGDAAQVLAEARKTYEQALADGAQGALKRRCRDSLERLQEPTDDAPDDAG